MTGETDFERFFKENFQRFYLYALHLVNDEEMSRDIVYEAVEHLWRQDVPVEKWFSYTVSNIRNKCIDQLRRRSVHQKYADFYVNILSHQEEMGYQEDDERMKAICRVMETLPPKTQAVMRECYFNNRRQKDVAEEMGVSTNMVKKRVVGALRTIREELAKQGFHVVAKKT